MRGAVGQPFQSDAMVGNMVLDLLDTRTLVTLNLGLYGFWVWVVRLGLYRVLRYVPQQQRIKQKST